MDGLLWELKQWPKWKQKTKKNANKLIRFWQNRCQKNVKVIPVTHGSLLSVLSSFSRPLVDKLYSNKNVEIIARLSKRLGSSVFPFVLFPVGAYKVSWIRAYKKLEGLGSVHNTAHESYKRQSQDNFATTYNLTRL